jgi:hypothetical protein
MARIARIEQWRNLGEIIRRARASTSADLTQPFRPILDSLLLRINDCNYLVGEAPGWRRQPLQFERGNQ